MSRLLKPLFVLVFAHLALRALTVWVQMDSLAFHSARQVVVGVANDLAVSLLLFAAFLLALLLGRVPPLGKAAAALRVLVSVLAVLTLGLIAGNFGNVALTGNNISLEEFTYLNWRDGPTLLGSASGYLLAPTGIPVALGAAALTAFALWLLKAFRASLAEAKTLPTRRLGVVLLLLTLVSVGVRSYSLSAREILYEPVESHVIPQLMAGLTSLNAFALEKPSRGLELYRADQERLGGKDLGDSKRPLLTERDFRTTAETASTPLGVPPKLPAGTNVVVILLESFGRGTTDKGPKVVPFFDELLAQGLSLEQHYTTAFRTVGAQFSVLCSQHNPLPFYVSRQFPRTVMRCLPEVMKDLGYSTHWIAGTTKLGDYDGEWLGLNGIDQRIAEEDYPAGTPRFSYGIHDGPMYDRLLKELDQAKAPFFTYAVTISTHHPFVVPDGFLAAHPEAQGLTNVDQAFYYAGTELRRFFAEAKTKPWYNNTLFVVFGDHAAWGTEGGSPTDPDFQRTRNRYHTSAAFLHPLIKTARFAGDTSHVDLAPTILDLLGVKAATEFSGQSVYAWHQPPALGSQENARDTFYTIHSPDRVIYRSAVGRLCQMALRGQPAKARACDADAWQTSEDFKAEHFDTVQWEVMQLQGLNVRRSE